MSTAYVSEIRLMAFNFPPRGWALCNGQLMAIQQNQTLFTLIGTTYGGDGIRTFALPNLQGRSPLHFGTDTANNVGYTLGQAGGEATHTLVLAEMAAHGHMLRAVDATATTGQPGNTVALAQGLAKQGATQTTPANLYGAGAADITMAGNAIAPGGGGQGHPNQQPYLTLNFCIALTGMFPRRS